MHTQYTIAYVDQPEQTARKIIEQGIHTFNNQQAGEYHYQSLCYALYDSDRVIVGGISAATYWDWLSIELLWVKQELRGCGYGYRLLSIAEEEARRRGAKNAYLDTFSFQAPDFYLQHGYRVFGELEDFPAGHKRYFLTKQL